MPTWLWILVGSSWSPCCCSACICIYNRLVRLRARVDNGWSQIDVQLRRRYDLIPNLVETVKGYATHERELFEHVTEARAGGDGRDGVAEPGAGREPDHRAASASCSRWPRTTRT